MTETLRTDAGVFAPDGISRGVLRCWLKKPGEWVAADAPVAEIETDKAVVEAPAAASGWLEAVRVREGEPVAEGQRLASLRLAPSGAATGEATGAASGVATGVGTPPAPAAFASLPSSGLHASPRLRTSPLVRRALGELDIDPETIAGAGHEGRITYADVQKATLKPGAEAPPASHIVPHTLMRRQIAERVTAACLNAPHVTAMFEADFSAVLAHRNRLRSEDPDRWGGLSLMPYILLACARAMRVAPEVNARWRDDGVEIFDRLNIAVITSLKRDGLVAPVIRNVEGLSFEELWLRLKELIPRARRRSLAPEETRDGTFSISNYGESGALFAAPIILNRNQGAILGLGKVHRRVILSEHDAGKDDAGKSDAGEIDVGKDDFGRAARIGAMAYVSLSIDHRFLDAWHTNTWLSRFVETIENWTARADETA